MTNEKREAVLDQLVAEAQASGEYGMSNLSYQIDTRNPSAGFIGQTEQHDD